MDGQWCLPDGVDELLPPQAGQIESLRRKLLDLFRLWGYELVSPPMLEFLDALMAGSGDDLALLTFKVTDQISGRTLGFRADISSQAARIDAKNLLSEGPQRLCYAGTVLLTRPPVSGEGRCPVKIGAELYGHKGIESDIEILRLMVETLTEARLPAFHIELGHVQIFRQLIEPLRLPQERESLLFQAVQTKATSDLQMLLSKWNVPSANIDQLIKLPGLMGSGEVLTEARRIFVDASPEIQTALDELEGIASALERILPDLSVTFDLAELRGYCYHTGVLYTAYADDLGQPIAKGGRYDGLGEMFGRSRPATGFDADLKVLARLGAQSAGDSPARTILAPWRCEEGAEASQKLDAKVRQLRAQGDCVILNLPNTSPPSDSLRLEWLADDWTVTSG